MRTKRPASESRELKEMPSPAESASEPQDDISRLSFAVDSQGNVLWDRMRGKTKDQLKEILTKPETAKALGITSEQAAQTVEVFDPEWTGSLYDSLGKMEAFLAGKIYKIPADIADQAFTYSEKEKEKLASPTAKVINKYASAWMVQFKDEIALAFLFVTITAVKLQMATTLTQMRAKVESSAAPSRPTVVRSEPSAADLDAIELERMTKDQTAQA